MTERSGATEEKESLSVHETVWRIAEKRGWRLGDCELTDWVTTALSESAPAVDRNAVLEEAAKVADNDWTTSRYGAPAVRIAAAIRALKNSDAQVPLNAAPANPASVSEGGASPASSEPSARCVAAAPDPYVVAQARLVIHDGFAINKVALAMARELISLGERPEKPKEKA